MSHHLPSSAHLPTAPILKLGGLENRKIQDYYVQNASAILNGWNANPAFDKQQRLHDLEYLANQTLGLEGQNKVKFKTPDVQLVDSADVDWSTGYSFNPQTWQVAVPSAILHSTPLSQAVLADLAEKVFHESRHAEQFFLVAQYIVQDELSQGTAPHELTNRVLARVNLPKEIIQDAIKTQQGRPLDSQQVNIAKKLHQSLYVDGQKHKQTSADVRKEQDRVFSLDKNSPDYFSALDYFNQHILPSYLNIPHEGDAWQLGKQVKAKFKALNQSRTHSPGQEALAQSSIDNNPSLNDQESPQSGIEVMPLTSTSTLQASLSEEQYAANVLDKFLAAIEQLPIATDSGEQEWEQYLRAGLNAVIQYDPDVAPETLEVLGDVFATDIQPVLDSQIADAQRQPEAQLTY